MVPTAVLPQSKSVLYTAARPVSDALLNLPMTQPRHAYRVVTKSNSPIKTHLPRSPSSKNSISPSRLTAAKAPVGNPQQALKDNGVIDSGCSRHMTGIMSYLSGFKELNGGYVAFRGNPKGVKITGNGKIKTGTINYHPVSVAHQPISSAGFQDPFDVEKVGEEVTQTYVLFPVCSAQTRKQADKTEREHKGKSHVESFIGYRDLNAEFEECSNNNSNGVNAASSTVPTVGYNFINNTNTFSAAGPSNTTVSPTYEKSSFTAASTSSHDRDMPALEDFTYSEDEDAVAMQEELLQFKMQKVWILVNLPYGKRAIAYASFMGFMVYQMDVKSAFLYGTIEEEVYVCQPPRFKDPDHPDKVYKVVKALYGLHQAPRACQYKYVAEILRKFGLTEGKSVSTPTDTEKSLLKDLEGEDVDVHTYRSMIGFLMYLTSSRPDIMFAVSKNWLVQKQMALGKDTSNPLIADNLPKISTDVTRLQALVNRKKVVISEAVLRDVLRLDDAESIDCLPNEEIFTGLARMGSKFYMYPRFIQLIIQNQLGDLSTHTTKYISPALTQKVFVNMRRIGKGFSGVETPLFEGMLVRENVEADIREEQVPDDIAVAAAQEVVTTAALEDVLTAVLEDVHNESILSPTPPTSPPPLSQDIITTSQAQSPLQQL
nr:hypothetical protein [Tanacetum cinerariifolium]